MKKQSGETNSTDSKLARRDFVRTTAAAGAGLLIVPSAVAVGSTSNQSAPFSRACDVAQGFNFKPEMHSTVGYLNTCLVAKTTTLMPDFKVGAPAVDQSGIISKTVVGVLSQVTWSTLPNENITVEARLSQKNAQALNLLVKQGGLQSLVVSVSVVVYEYDPLSKFYFPCFKSYKGSIPGGLGAPSGIDDTNPPIYGVVSQIGTHLEIEVDLNPIGDILGILNYQIRLILAPTIAPARQQILIQNSGKNKLIKPWGILKS